jgi:hypothetical protein
MAIDDFDQGSKLSDRLSLLLDCQTIYLAVVEFNLLSATILKLNAMLS